MIPQLLTMITGKDDQGVVILPRFLEIADDAPEMIIDLTDHAIIGCAHAAHLLLGHGTPKAPAIPEELRLFR